MIRNDNDIFTDSRFTGFNGNTFTNQDKNENLNKNSRKNTSKVPALIVLTVLCCGLLAFVWSIVLGVI